jgi:TonB family protein
MKSILFILLTAIVHVYSPAGGTTPVDLCAPDSLVAPQLIPARADWLGPEITSIEDYLKQYVNYPEAARRNEEAGTSIVEFTVTEKGELLDFQVINPVSDEIDREMIRALNQTNGLWEPGRLNGAAVPMKKEVSLLFVPDERFDLEEAADKHLKEGSEALFAKDDPRQALFHLNEAVKLLPYNRDILSVRSLCKYEMGDKEGAREDWERVINMKIGETTKLETGFLIIKMKELDSYDEFDRTIKQPGQ